MSAFHVFIGYFQFLLLLAHFQNSFTHPLVKQELDNFLLTEIQLNEKGIDNATEAIDKIIRTSADFGLKKKRPKDKFRHQNKNWFDFELKVKKKEVYNEARLMSMFQMILK